MIRLTGNPATPTEVWTGSTNITPSGFLGQSNVGHLINDQDVAEHYLKYWTILSDNPTTGAAKTAVAEISPFPPPLVKPDSKSCVYSPRQTASMLNWYADRISDARCCCHSRVSADRAVMVCPFKRNEAIRK